MNKKIGIIALAICLSCVAGTFVMSGCKSTPRAIATNTIFTLQKTTVAAYDSYITGVISGDFKTNGVPQISRKFNSFQVATLVAMDAVEFNTNALPPTSLTVLSSDLLNLIATFTKK